MIWLLACTAKPTDSGDSSWDRGANPHPLDDLLRLDQVQAEGSHNSTHQEPDTPLDDSHRYTHAPLGEQLAELGVRQLELDLHLHEELGLQVFHIPNIDGETSCLAFADCLREIKEWSDAVGWHLPLMIWLEPKDDLDGLVEGYDTLDGKLDRIDQAILEVWPRSRVFAPDDLRGEHPDLPTALAAEGWPTLGELRGRVIFALLDSGAHRDDYVDGHPALEDRLLFVDASSPTDPFAATFKDGSDEEIRALVEQGFLVTANAALTGASDEEMAAELAGRLAAGAQFIATDFPGPVEGQGFEAVIPGGTPARCNPLRAPEACTSEAVESLPRR